jgi:hypothetical protein
LGLVQPGQQRCVFAVCPVYTGDGVRLTNQGGGDVRRSGVHPSH